jgi:hypothetical protein
MTDDPTFRQQLRDSLVSAARRRRRTRRLRRMSGLAGVAVIATVIAVVGTQAPSPNSDASALTIVREGDGIHVTLDDLQAKPDEIKAELKAAGLSANVQEMPAPPSLVGKFVFGERTGVSKSTGVTALDGSMGDGFRSFVFQPGGPAVSLVFGRPARDDEFYFKWVSAFSPGEPLHCSGLNRLDPVDAYEKFRERGFRVTWKRYIESGVTDTSVASERDSKIVSVLHSAAHELVVYVTAPDDQRIPVTTHDDGCSPRPSDR